MNKPHFILINGHGGMVEGKYQTKGKQFHHPNGKSIYEGVFNRIVVADICDICDDYGYSYTNLVPEQLDISLAERVKRADKVLKQYPNAIIIEVHANAGRGTGMEVFTTVGKTKSDGYAEKVIKAMEKQIPELPMRKDTRDGDSDKEAQFYLISKAKAPAMLIECAFMDTYEPDCRMMLKTPKRFSEAIFKGMHDIYNSF
jgi:N-acetylmuramoyl-L-alanine amidase